MDWPPPTSDGPDGWMFVYDGGVLTEDMTARIRLPSNELVEWRFVPIADLEQYVPGHLARRLRTAHKCALAGTTTDLEDGRIPRGLE